MEKTKKLNLIHQLGELRYGNVLYSESCPKVKGPPVKKNCCTYYLM